MTDTTKSLNTLNVVEERYSAAAEEREASLCCPVDYDAKYLEIIPDEVIERDYGCGDPSKYLMEGETVLDLGSGGGKICFIASQVVGDSGRVIGVDMNDTMLDLARRSQEVVASKLGYDNVEFRKGKIQDLAVDRDAVNQYLIDHPVTDESSLRDLESHLGEMRSTEPMIADNSVDVVVSNCVLNLVDASEKEELFRELFRVLKPGGRAVISDIVSDEFVPIAMQNDADLWSGCISGAYQEQDFLKAFERAGFHGIQIAVYQEKPWQTVEGIEFRSVTVIAYKVEEGSCDDYHEAVIYRGPYARVIDDNGHVYERGLRSKVCRSTFEMMSERPYQDDFVRVPPHLAVTADQAAPMSCDGDSRPPSVTKGKDYNLTVLGQSCCEPGECC
ncbi:methyltransferase domain-containing protein [bacterium]|nr:methyltransferase domain-containing protein [bacterium]MDB4809707.1 methyltransferase domain-containing protein [bacterium]